MQEIIIDIDLEGNPKITVNGCPGPSCKKLTADIEKALGATMQDKPTGEFYAKAKIGVVNKQ